MFKVVNPFKFDYTDLKRDIKYLNISDEPIFKIHNINDILPNEKYIVYIAHEELFKYEMSWIHYYNESSGKPDFVSSIYEKILNDSRNGLVHWIISWNWEAIYHDRVIKFDKLINDLNLENHPQNLTYITCAQKSYNKAAQKVKNKFGINTLYYNAPELAYHNNDMFEKIPNFMNEKTEKILNKEILDYKSVCYNRRFRRHRLIVASHMDHQNFIKDSLFSLSGIDMDNFVPDSNRDLYESEFHYLKDSYDKLLNNIPIYCDINEYFEKGDDRIKLTSSDYYTANIFISKIDLLHALNSSFHIVT